jgi:hypothetical protein
MVRTSGADGSADQFQIGCEFPSGRYYRTVQ